MKHISSSDSWYNWIENKIFGILETVDIIGYFAAKRERERLDRERLEEARLIAAERMAREVDAAARAAKERDAERVRAHEERLRDEREKELREKQEREKEESLRFSSQYKKYSSAANSDIGCPGAQYQFKYDFYVFGKP